MIYYIKATDQRWQSCSYLANLTTDEGAPSRPRSSEIVGGVRVGRPAVNEVRTSESPFERTAFFALLGLCFTRLLVAQVSV
jgi:hypothetical protein